MRGPSGMRAAASPCQTQPLTGPGQSDISYLRAPHPKQQAGRGPVTPCCGIRHGQHPDGSRALPGRLTPGTNRDRVGRQVGTLPPSAISKPRPPGRGWVERCNLLRSRRPLPPPTTSTSRASPRTCKSARCRSRAWSSLLDEGNTVPFITRYRKERTGGLNEEVIRAHPGPRRAQLRSWPSASRRSSKASRTRAS